MRNAAKIKAFRSPCVCKDRFLAVSLQRIFLNFLENHSINCIKRTVYRVNGWLVALDFNAGLTSIKQGLTFLGHKNENAYCEIKVTVGITFIIW